MSNKSPLKVMLLILAGLAILAVLAVAGFAWGIMSMLKGDAYEQSLQVLEESPAVIERLGSPLEPSWLVSGNINFDNDGGRADLSYAVHGPQDAGQVSLLANRVDKQWQLHELQLQPDGGGQTLVLIEDGQTCERDCLR